MQGYFWVTAIAVTVILSRFHFIEAFRHEDKVAVFNKIYEKH
ncbi:hypothetical protein APHWI1_0541 [Anaplasma phagocytophilum str. ApWI1]|uniref:Uncharacterized protein n=2 Tax=Anaplasma phagocytophilum TaxID=948 RepID=A0A0F3N4E0_ANAPH|nr:hypothetical protein APHWEB_0971 [Anaplasma phagocytophilum str. Webster]KJV62958.1 hypothetical protein EPHNCH_1358 [Anaplasma phagocytophilum str. NCH-1]KJV84233.1 hypothetical protein APHWI1_0541 [Anaplasma phagocytophilum str. ApWI1]KJV87312.1 hypothetical protein APHNYW_1055 [Anaplasma phagocytophilum str. ApNYW]KJV98442.1 hypothetical protein OTSANNIE_1312 [Anaplasma phagocytophilum str. Annie]KJZ98797.1 hypothetical protein APHCR_0522 [Anaplasma phagocytophilum str. CR1007]